MFQAGPVPYDVIEQPFVPKKSEKPVTEPEDVALRTSARSDERKVYEEEKKKRELEELEVKQRMEALQKVN